MVDVLHSIILGLEFMLFPCSIALYELTSVVEQDHPNHNDDEEEEEGAKETEYWLRRGGGRTSLVDASNLERLLAGCCY